MQNNEMQAVIANQRAFFSTGKTLDIHFRLAALKKLKAVVLKNVDTVSDALKKDLKKPLVESYTSELFMIINEINTALKNLKKWVKPEKVRSTFMDFPSRGYMVAEPYGMVLIISPWNYPFQLTLVPVVGAIAAGNCCIVKPSELSPASTHVLKKIIDDAFDRRHAAVIDGDVETSQVLLTQKWDKIFFTGSGRVGKIVMESAAKHLTPVTLELGGKNPCIVDKNVNLDIAIKRIIFGKFINAGQTCIAPDYLLAHKEIKRQLFHTLKKRLIVFYTEHPEQSPDLGRIINRCHFNRLIGYLKDGTIIIGGGYDEQTLFIAPTVMEISDVKAPVMQEEIFGPILPVIEYSSPEDVMKIVSLHPDPLSFYIFSTDKKLVKRLMQRIPFGGGCINDTLSHTFNPLLRFGGRGFSGMGGYHGIHSFNEFSHRKSILQKGFHFDLKVKYPPYGDGYRYIKKFLLR